MASNTDPEGKQANDLGNGIAVYSFRDGKIAPDDFIRIPLQPVPAGKVRNPALPMSKQETDLEDTPGLVLVSAGAPKRIAWGESRWLERKICRRVKRTSDVDTLGLLLATMRRFRVRTKDSPPHQ